MTYTEWIAAYASGDVRARCGALTHAMAAAFPELRCAFGLYNSVLPPRAGFHTHWWCVTPAGQVVDPSARQFPEFQAGQLSAPTLRYWELVREPDPDGFRRVWEWLGPIPAVTPVTAECARGQGHQGVHQGKLQWSPRSAAPPPARKS